MTGVVQNQDSYMKGRIGQRAYTDRLPAILADAYEEFGRLTGRTYGPVSAYRTEDAREILVGMGTMADTAIAVVDHLRAQGRPVGCVGGHVLPALPDRRARGGRAGNARCGRRSWSGPTSPLAAANPLTREVRSALYVGGGRGRAGAARALVLRGPRLARRCRRRSRRRLRSRWPTTRIPQRRRVVLGIRHPLALAATRLDLRPPGAYSLRGHSIGGFGSVTTNKLVATLTGELFGKQVQAYPRYGSEKKGLPTTYYLTIADAPIRAPRRTGPGGLRAAPRRLGVRPRRSARRTRRRRRPVHPVAAADAEAIWASIPAPARAEIARPRHPRHRPGHGGPGTPRMRPGPELEIRMQGVALVGRVPARLRRSRRRPARPGRSCSRRSASSCGRFFGKRGSAVIKANLAVIRGLRRAHDVTAPSMPAPTIGVPLDLGVPA